MRYFTPLIIEFRGFRGFIALMALLLAQASFAETGNAFEARVDVDGVQRVTVTAGSYFFKPDRIVVKKGVPVELIVRKEAGLTPHNIVIEGIIMIGGIGDDLNLREKLSTTKPVTISFTPESVGTYPFWCDKGLLFFKDHRAKGMEGVIEVVP